MFCFLCSLALLTKQHRWCIIDDGVDQILSIEVRKGVTIKDLIEKGVK